MHIVSEAKPKPSRSRKSTKQAIKLHKAAMKLQMKLTQLKSEA